MIELKNVGKSFELKPDGGGGVRHALFAGVKSLYSKEERAFWALRDITLTVRRGESVGLIGPNGCGKSTLLRVVAGITKPTTGTVSVSGRVAGLIELTAGFNDELTGLENLYLNGAALGMSRERVDELLPGISDFADIGHFIHVPVRCYSAGMLLRLGFALAIHSQPDVLVVDEALAVGDSAFQRKCLDRIRAMRAEGVTMLFVSHAPELVEDVCDRAVWLEGGEIKLDDSAFRVLQAYNRHVFRQLSVVGQSRYDEMVTGIVSGGRFGDGSGVVRIEDVQVIGPSGEEQYKFQMHDSMEIRATVVNNTDAPVRATFGWNLNLIAAGPVCRSNSEDSGVIYTLEPGTNVVRCQFPDLALRPNTYVVSMGLLRPGVGEDSDRIYDSYMDFARLHILSDDLKSGFGLIEVSVKTL